MDYALPQMLMTLSRLDKLAALRCIFAKHKMMLGTTTWYTAMSLVGTLPQDGEESDPSDQESDNETGAARGPSALSSVKLAAKPTRGFPKTLLALSHHVTQPKFPEAIRRFLYDCLHPDSNVSSANIPFDQCPSFAGRITVYPSATARFHSPSDLCGVGGMCRERIR
ncbi:hypothetical protein C8J56DRAFT_789233 [Mycena floridula]|nr:hypothetical protein C8J56DRAFT_789233 [Mycena floridula]